mgnify:FL=1
MLKVIKKLFTSKPQKKIKASIKKETFVMQEEVLVLEKEVKNINKETKDTKSSLTLGV